MVDVLLRADPSRQRAEGERIQADEIYPIMKAFKIPPPREPSPEPSIPPPSEYLNPCPNCAPNNPYNYTCPIPVQTPSSSSSPNDALAPTSASNGGASSSSSGSVGWLISDGPPPGHAFCGHCESLLALRSPLTSRCDFCCTSFCGIAVPGRCNVRRVEDQSPEGLSELSDLVQCPEVYERFENADGETGEMEEILGVGEVEKMIEWMREKRLSLRQVYQQIVSHITMQPLTFTPLVEQGLFDNMHLHSDMPPPSNIPLSSPRKFERICRSCAGEVFFYGIRDWWMRENARNRERERMRRMNATSGVSDEISNNQAPFTPSPFPPFSRVGASSISASASGPMTAHLPRLPPLPSLPDGHIPNYLTSGELVSSNSSSDPGVRGREWVNQGAERVQTNMEPGSVFGPRSHSLARRIGDLLNPHPPVLRTGPSNQESLGFGMDEATDVDDEGEERNDDDQIYLGRPRDPPSDDSQDSVEAILGSAPASTFGAGVNFESSSSLASPVMRPNGNGTSNTRERLNMPRSFTPYPFLPTMSQPCTQTIQQAMSRELRGNGALSSNTPSPSGFLGFRFITPPLMENVDASS